MDPKIKELAPIIWAEIEKAQKILLHCHPNPDQDSFGSTLAAKAVLELAGKEVTLIKGDSEIPNFVQFLPGAETVVAKNIFEVDLTAFDLFLILDSSSWERVTTLGPVSLPPNLQTVVIDHHASNESFGHINLILTSYPATGQIMFDLFKEWPVQISEAAALCLMAAISSDTGGFKYRHTTAHTFKIAAELAAIAPTFDQLLARIDGSKTVKSAQFIGYVLANMEVLFGGQVVIGAIDSETIKRMGLTKQDTRNTGIASMLRDLEGVKMSFFIIEDEPGMTGISARSTDGEKYNVAELLKNHFNGGGHKVAAGTTVAKSLPEVKAELIQALMAMLQ